MTTLQAGLVPLSVSPHQPQVSPSDRQAALPARGQVSTRTLVTLLRPSWLALGKDPLITVCAVAEVIPSEEPGQHDNRLRRRYYNYLHNLRLSRDFPTAGVATLPHLLRLIIAVNPVFVPGRRREQSRY